MESVTECLQDLSGDSMVVFDKLLDRVSSAPIEDEPEDATKVCIICGEVAT